MVPDVLAGEPDAEGSELPVQVEGLAQVQPDAEGEGPDRRGAEVQSLGPGQGDALGGREAQGGGGPDQEEQAGPVHGDAQEPGPLLAKAGLARLGPLQKLQEAGSAEGEGSDHLLGDGADVLHFAPEEDQGEKVQGGQGEGGGGEGDRPAPREGVDDVEEADEGDQLRVLFREGGALVRVEENKNSDQINDKRTENV